MIGLSVDSPTLARRLINLAKSFFRLSSDEWGFKHWLPILGTFILLHLGSGHKLRPQFINRRLHPTVPLL
jgi:hypothetical protein